MCIPNFFFKKKGFYRSDVVCVSVECGRVSGWGRFQTTLSPLTNRNLSPSRGQNLGTVMGCSNSTPAVLETCLQEANVTELLMRQYNVFASGDLLGIPFPPVVDGVFLPNDVNVCFFMAVFVCLYFFVSI